MDVNGILRDCQHKMDKSLEYFRNELRGIRTGRATTALIDFVKVDYYGSATELRELAAISVTDPTSLVVKPFDPGSVAGIVKALESADLGLNPQADGPAIRISVPPPSVERRKQLVTQVRKMTEDARVAGRPSTCRERARRRAGPVPCPRARESHPGFPVRVAARRAA